jgi:hypothetical protein
VGAASAASFFVQIESRSSLLKQFLQKPVLSGALVGGQQRYSRQTRRTNKSR